MRDTAYFASTPIALSTSPTSSAYSSSSVSDNTDDDEPAGPPSYQSIFPPSPPSSAPSSPSDSILSKFAQRQVVVAAPLATPPLDHDASVPRPATLLETVFPASSSIHAFPAFPVDLTSTIGHGWKGVVVDNVIAGTRTLYVGGGKFDDVELRDTVCDVLDQAEEEYGATGVVLCFEKGNNKEQLGLVVHQLMYIGCTVLNQDGLEPNPAYLLLGMDL